MLKTAFMGNTIIKAKKTLLWTNPSPTALFVTQTVSLDLSDYDEVAIEVSMYIDNNILYCETFFGRVGTSLIFSAYTFGGGTLVTRTCAINSNGIIFGSAFAGGIYNDSAVIPIRIYGIR